MTLIEPKDSLSCPEQPATWARRIHSAPSQTFLCSFYYYHYLITPRPSKQWH